MPAVTDTSRRIALVIHALDGGGAERLMSQLASRWADAGHCVHLLTLSSVHTDRYRVAEQVVRHGFGLMQPSRGLIDGWRANLKRVRRLRKELTALKPEFILSFCDRMNIVTAAAAQRLQVPLWVAEHSDPRQQHLGMMWEAWRSITFRRLARRKASGCIALTESIAQALQKRFPTLSLRVIPPAISPPAHLTSASGGADEPSDDSQSRNTGAHRKKLLTLGRHSPEKNLVSLLHAWKRVSNQFPDWQWIMAGDGPQHNELRSMSEQLGLQMSVTLPGWVSDPWPLYAQCDLLALPSHYEGFPVSLLEAMSVGVPCISSPSCDSVSMMADAGALRLSRSASAEDLAVALRSMMSDRTTRQHLGAKGRNYSAAYRWEEVGLLWDRLLASPLAPLG